MKREKLKQKVAKGVSLTEEENRYLFSVMNQNPKEVISILTIGNRALIERVGRRYRQEPEYEDLLQEGYLALYDAVENYEPTRMSPFTVYASVCIRNRMIRYLHTKGRLIPIPYYAHNKAKYRMQKLPVLSLDRTEEREQTEITFLDLIPSTENVEMEVTRRLEAEHYLQGLDECLNDKERDILTDYFGLKGKQELSGSEIRDKYQVSPQYMYYIKRSALEKIRKRGC